MFWTATQPYIVSIPQPCHENWAGMEAVERGRYCQACQTVVTDFTNLSDDEIVQHIKKAAGGSMCGRFTHAQINRPLLPEIKAHRISHFRKIAASAFLFYASVSEALAQVPASAHSTYSSVTTKKPAPKFTGITISGKVIDFTGQGLANLELEIMGTDSVKLTDAYGRFKFKLPSSFAGQEITIVATTKGATLLDSTGSFIHDTKLCVNSAPGRKEITIYRYPIAVLSPIIESMSVIIDRDPENTRQETVIISSTGKVSCPMPAKPAKLSVSQKFKNFFKKKKKS